MLFPITHFGFPAVSRIVSIQSKQQKHGEQSRFCLAIPSVFPAESSIEISCPQPPSQASGQQKQLQCSGLSSLNTTSPCASTTSAVNARIFLQHCLWHVSDSSLNIPITWPELGSVIRNLFLTCQPVNISSASIFCFRWTEFNEAKYSRPAGTPEIFDGLDIHCNGCFVTGILFCVAQSIICR